MNVEAPTIILAAVDNERKGKGERSSLPFENSLRSYLHGSISRETAERKSIGWRLILSTFFCAFYLCVIVVGFIGACMLCHPAFPSTAFLALISLVIPLQTLYSHTSPRSLFFALSLPHLLCCTILPIHLSFFGFRKFISPRLFLH